MTRKTQKKTQSEFAGVDINYIGSKSELAEERTVESRKKLRDMLETQIEAFISSGGEITRIDNNTTAESVNNPQSTYGNRPI